MRTLKSFLRDTILLFILLLSISSDTKAYTPEIVLVGSTPGDEIMKSMLSIPADTKIDFMKWHLKLDNKNSFILNLVFGESQPNTLGFKNGGENRTIKGTFSLNENAEKSNFQEIYQLESNSLPEKISLVKLSQNLFHILTPQNQLMNGNGGWSYSLNRKNPVSSDKILFSSKPSDEQTLQLVFDGRTPCREIAAEHPEMSAGQSCFKLKWRLILVRDSVTHQPSVCTIRNIVNNQPLNISGKWKIIHGTDTNPNVIIYKIEVDNLAEPILFLVGDENVLFFLNRNNEPFVGNEDFSFVLNKKIET